MRTILLPQAGPCPRRTQNQGISSSWWVARKSWMKNEGKRQMDKGVHVWKGTQEANGHTSHCRHWWKSLESRLWIFFYKNRFRPYVDHVIQVNSFVAMDIDLQHCFSEYSTVTDCLHSKPCLVKTGSIELMPTLTKYDILGFSPINAKNHEHTLATSPAEDTISQFLWFHQSQRHTAYAVILADKSQEKSYWLEKAVQEAFRTRITNVRIPVHC